MHNLAQFLALATLCQSVPRPHNASSIVIQQSASSYLGVAVLEIDTDRAKALKLKEERGVEIKVVEENSPASKAGLRETDVVLEYNGQRIEGIAQFIRMVSETPAGRKVTMQISRNGAIQTVPVTIEARSGRGGFSFTAPPMPPAPAMPVMPAMPEIPMTTPRLGIEIEFLNSQLADYFGVKDGVLIRFVSQGSPAEKAGLKAGDVITRVNGDAIHNSGDLTMKILPPNPGKSVSLTIMRNHKELTVDVVLRLDRRGQLDRDSACYTA